MGRGLVGYLVIGLVGLPVVLSTLNFTTHTHGLASQLSRPLMEHHRL